MDHEQLDPQLQLLASRLASQAPKLSAQRQDELLYRCAFDAGRQSVHPRLRLWRATSAVLAALALILGVQAQPPPAAQPSPPIGSRELVEHKRDDILEAMALAHQSTSVELEAWQVPTGRGAALARQLAQFEEVPPEVQALTVQSLARELSDL